MLRPRPRRTIRREIIAVIVPAWYEPGDDVTSHRRAAGVRGRAGRGPARPLPPARRGGHRHRRRPPRAPAAPRRPRAPVRSACRRWPTTRSRSSTVSASTPASSTSASAGPASAASRAPRRPAARRPARPPTPSRQRDFQPRAARRARPREEPVGEPLDARPARSLAATLGGLVLPFLALVLLHQVGLDLSDVLYWVLVGSLAITAAADLGRVRPGARPAPAPRRARTGRRHAPAP